MNEPIVLTVDTETLPRADKFIADSLPELSRNSVITLIENGDILLNGGKFKKNAKLKIGDILKITLPELSECEATAQNIPLDIVYEDDDLLIVNKPKGMVVHPAPGNPDGTLVNALLYHCGDSLSGINGVIRPGIVHRIDKNTSGLLIVAKNDNSHRFLAQQIKEHSFKREYEAVVVGNVKDDSGTVDAPIGRHPIKRKQMAVTDKNSKNAVTHYNVIERFGTHTHLRLKLETGRTHQIRVHMSYLGKPVAGDELYGAKPEKHFEGQCLHAKTIGFIHPNGKYLEFNSELPEYFTNYLTKLKRISYGKV